jgi:hypothetical protein
MLGLDPHKETIMENKKKTWIRPQLIVLGRGQPEENVLVACKNETAGIDQGPGAGEGCRVNHPRFGTCKTQFDT